jgi:hypothetical protein
MSEKDHYKLFNRFVLRTPLRPFDFFKQFISNNTSALDELKAELNDPILKEAIFLSSPDLYNSMDNWQSGKSISKKDEERLISSLIKYISRLSTRCTPFGLFAGVSVGRFDADDKLVLPETRGFRRNLRLDMNFTVSLSLYLSELPEIKQQIKYYPNSSSYTSFDQLRFIEYYYKNGFRFHQISAVDNSEYLQIILKKAEKGALTSELVNVIVNDDITQVEAEDFVEELINNQILVSELEPSVSGNDLFEQIILVINKLSGLVKIKKSLKEIQNIIEQINIKPLGIKIDEYLLLVEKLKKFDIDFQLKYLFQVDMSKPTPNLTINQDIADNLLKALIFLNRITPRIEVSNLSKFKDAFYEKYEEAEVPLLHALDAESGVGYANLNAYSSAPSPLIDDIGFPNNQTPESYSIKWDAINSFILKKYFEFNKKGDIETDIVITDDEIEKFTVKPKWNDLPITFSAIGQLYKRNGEIEVYMRNAGGSSANTLLGRFAHTDTELNDLVKEIANYEKANKRDAILAEIVHLPEARTGNILLRPSIREYEIPYLAKSNLDYDKWILPEDIMVSVKRNKIVLRSKRHNRVIIPYLSNAHNFLKGSLPVYQFLCDMQTQSLRGWIGFGWGALHNELDYFPRVRYKNIILSFAEWKIITNDIKKLFGLSDDVKLYEEVEKWRVEKGIPVWVSLVDGDNNLTLNLKNILCIKTLVSLVKMRPYFILTEYYLNEENGVIYDQSGTYANEFVFAFKKSRN